MPLKQSKGPPLKRWHGLHLEETGTPPFLKEVMKIPSLRGAVAFLHLEEMGVPLLHQCGRALILKTPLLTNDGQPPL